MKTARIAVILAIATALIFVMYRLRPKSGVAPAPEQHKVAAYENSPVATASMTEPAAEASDNLPELIPLPLAPIAIEAENGMWRTNSDYQIIPHGTQSLGGIEFVFDGLLQLQSTSSEAFNRSYRTNIALALAEAGAAGGKFGSLHVICGTRGWSKPQCSYHSSAARPRLGASAIRRAGPFALQIQQGSLAQCNRRRIRPLAAPVSDVAAQSRAEESCRGHRTYQFTRGSNNDRAGGHT
jgi:hypothetical protein